MTKTAIGIIVFPFFCLLLSLQVLVSDPAFTYHSLKNPEAIEPTKQLFKYFEGRAEMPEIFNAEERSHLADVKHVLNYAYYLLEFFAIVLIFCMMDNWKKIIKYGTLLLLALLLFAYFIPFEAFFTYFHKIVFPQGNWQFPADSTLIQFYPGTFFALYAIAIAVNSLIAALSFFPLIVSRKG